MPSAGHDHIRVMSSGVAPLTLDEIAAERARRNLIRFTSYTLPRYEVNWHHQVLGSYLDRVLSGEIRRLMAFMPPQNGKSELVSRRFPAYALGKYPDLRIIASSYSASLAGDMSRDVQKVMETDEYAALFPGTRLPTNRDTESRTALHFDIVGRAGYYRAAGVGGPITGKTANIGIIDDPVKNRDEAESEAFRRSVWGWYTSTFYTRLFGDSGSIIICLTRWHEDDLAGRLLRMMQEEPGADQWTVLNFPAIAEAERHADDPRTIGDPLWPSKYPLDELNRRRIVSGEYDWNALYQQHPIPPGGAMFKHAWFPIVDAAPVKARRCRGWDKAGTNAAGDWTAGGKVAEADGIIYIEDMIRDRLSSGARNKLIRQTAMLDGDRCHIRLEQEPGSGGKESAEISVRELAGYVVRVKPSTTDKVSRARPLASQAEAGNVRLVRGAWNRVFLDEITAFPFGEHDDQVDAVSSGFNELALGQREVIAAVTPGDSSWQREHFR
jgi:predicted phage terminase large subunit-like protein